MNWQPGLGRRTAALAVGVAVLLATATTAGASADDGAPNGADLEPETPPGVELAPVAAARADLAEQLGITVEEVVVVAVEPVEWSDSSLGCPEPGRFYLQVITPGYRVTLEAAGVRYVYHTDRAERAVTCLPPEAAPAPDEPPASEPAPADAIDQEVAPRPACPVRSDEALRDDAASALD